MKNLPTKKCVQQGYTSVQCVQEGYTSEFYQTFKN